MFLSLIPAFLLKNSKSIVVVYYYVSPVFSNHLYPSFLPLIFPHFFHFQCCYIHFFLLFIFILDIFVIHLFIFFCLFSFNRVIIIFFRSCSFSWFPHVSSTVSFSPSCFLISVSGYFLCFSCLPAGLSPQHMIDWLTWLTCAGRGYASARATNLNIRNHGCEICQHENHENCFSFTRDNSGRQLHRKFTLTFLIPPWLTMAYIPPRWLQYRRNEECGRYKTQYPRSHRSGLPVSRSKLYTRRYKMADCHAR